MKNATQAASQEQEGWKPLPSRVYKRWPGLMGRALIALSLVTVVLPVSYSAPPAAARHDAGGWESAYAEISELTSLDQLRTSFQNDVGKVRIIALLSPT